MTYPHEGGTTATVALTWGDQLTVGWVGDSRGVMASLAGGSQLRCSFATADHGVGYATSCMQRWRSCDDCLSFPGRKRIRDGTSHEGRRRHVWKVRVTVAGCCSLRGTDNTGASAVADTLQ